MNRWIGSATLLLATCSVNNPLYLSDAAEGSDLAASLDGYSTPDLGGSSDLNSFCTDGQRSCAGTVASVDCVNGQLALDRLCPSGSSCASGYCQAPPSMLGTLV